MRMMAKECSYLPVNLDDPPKGLPVIGVMN
jgi:hypothetical protein